MLTYFKTKKSINIDLRQIIISPYEYIRHDAQFISFKTCEYIDKIYNLNTDNHTRIKHLYVNYY